MQIFTGMMYVGAAACLVIVRGWKINQEIPKKKRLSVKSIEVEQPSILAAGTSLSYDGQEGFNVWRSFIAIFQWRRV